MSKRSYVFITGVQVIVLAFISFVVWLFTKNEALMVIAGVGVMVGFCMILVGEIINRLNELIDKLSPQAIYDTYEDVLIKIDLNNDRKRQHKKHSHYILGPHAFDKGYTSTYDFEEFDLTATTSSLDGTEDN